MQVSVWKLRWLRFSAENIFCRKSQGQIVSRYLFSEGQPVKVCFFNRVCGFSPQSFELLTASTDYADNCKGPILRAWQLVGFFLDIISLESISEMQ